MKKWAYQTADGLAVHIGNPCDSRGLRLRAECGYGWVRMGDAGWLQIHLAIAKLHQAERFSALAM